MTKLSNAKFIGVSVLLGLTFLPSRLEREVKLFKLIEYQKWLLWFHSRFHSLHLFHWTPNVARWHQINGTLISLISVPFNNQVLSGQPQSWSLWICGVFVMSRDQGTSDLVHGYGTWNGGGARVRGATRFIIPCLEARIRYHEFESPVRFQRAVQPEADDVADHCPDADPEWSSDEFHLHPRGGGQNGTENARCLEQQTHCGKWAVSCITEQHKFNQRQLQRKTQKYTRSAPRHHT
jgi:hypothetical protein